MLMVSMIILSAIVLAPVVLFFIFKSHGATAFMSLCLGYVLVTFAAPDIIDTLTEFFSIDPLFATQWAKIILLVLPLGLAMLFTARSIRGSGRAFLNLIPALATGALLALLVVPLLPAGLQHQLKDNEIWDTLYNLQTAILLAGAFFSLLFLFMSSHHGKEDKKEK
mgnify:FL=1